ncbi:MAG TPA: phosphoadenylyl-sulfate reductase [Acetobacteraceae bacterium]|nr:phosphoadenylyl-sulfate reductase [Acetobacteraceae bacterium]
MFDCAGEVSPADDLAARFGYLPAPRLLEALDAAFPPGRLALVSSFGTESAVLLHMVSRVDPALPVIFLDTGKLFPETLAYRDLLVNRLGLADVRSIRPDAARLAEYDPEGTLFGSDPDLCCAIRKTMPLDQALEGTEAWITGRKRAQGGLRGSIRAIETGPDGRIVINPLHDWTRAEIDAYFAAHALPRHPLEEQGYPSLGCATCTFRARAGEGSRAGRWAGTGKTECGIHLPRQRVT